MKKAFTLVELLIVIVIIGILATMAIPQYNKMIEKSKETQAFIKLDAFRKGQLIYYIQFGDWLDVEGPADPDYSAKLSVLDLEASDFVADKYFSYWWGTGVYTTPDGIVHKPGVAHAGRLDGNTIPENQIWLFVDDLSAWRRKQSTQEFGERIR